MSDTKVVESVWDYPRPPRLEACDLVLRIEHRGRLLAETRRGMRVLETSHPPVYYLPPGDVAMELLRPARQRGSFCEFKGVASYWDVVVGEEVSASAAWSYAAPTPRFAAIAGYLAFYATRVDLCSVDGEIVEPQPGDFYGGWITSWVKGPFKGAPGTMGW